MSLKIFLYKNYLSNFTERKIDNWEKNEDFQMLYFALKNGLFNIRFAAAKALGNLQSKESIPFLMESLHDRVEKVALESAKSLSKIGVSDENLIEINQVVEEWKIKEEAEKHIPDTMLKSPMPQWKKTNWRAIVKEQLKKPMRG